jgi:hypothetical protein
VPGTTFHLDILGASFFITVDEEAGFFEELLAAYRKEINNIQQATGVSDSLKTAIAAGLSFCGEVLKLQKRAGPEDSEAEKLTLTLISRLDEVLEKQPAADE